MEFDVRSALGVLSVRDIRAALGDNFWTARFIDAAVIDPETLSPVVARVKLMVSPAGRGEHLHLVCPTCGSAARSLRTAAGDLRCGRCRRRQTQAQNEGKTDWWKKYGGRQTDELVRLFAKGRRTPTAMKRAHELVEHLVHGDMKRAEALVEEVEEALSWEVIHDRS